MRKEQAGFTITELLVYTGILTIFLTVLTGIFTSVLDAQLESQTNSAVVQDSRYMIARLTYDIGRASSIVTPDSLGGQSSSLVLDISGTQHTYAVVDGNLQLTAGLTVGALNGYGTRVSNVSFRRYGNVGGKHSIRTAFTLTSTTQRPGGAQTHTYETTIGLR